MCTDQLLFEVINVGTGTDHQICAVSVCTSTVKCNIINLSYIINVDCIAIFDFKG